MTEPIIIKDPDILGGMPVFAGTRVPVQNLIDYLATGETIDAFLDDFPTVQREQIIIALDTRNLTTSIVQNGGRSVC